MLISIPLSHTRARRAAKAVEPSPPTMTRRRCPFTDRDYAGLKETPEFGESGEILEGIVRLSDWDPGGSCTADSQRVDATLFGAMCARHDMSRVSRTKMRVRKPPRRRSMTWTMAVDDTNNEKEDEESDEDIADVIVA
jgi:hypothetical protein